MYKVASLYKFSEILNPFKTHNDIRSKFKELSIVGTILVGEEGINGTISSSNNKDLIKAINYIKAIKGFKNDVDGNKYPNKNHTISMNDGELEQLIKALNK